MRLLDYVVNSSIQSFSEPPTYLTFDPSLTLEIFDEGRYSMGDKLVASNLVGAVPLR